MNKTQEEISARNWDRFDGLRQKLSLSISIWGFLLFVVMYIVAAMLYPGGSAVEPSADGFSFQHNYWCNLLNDPAINGKPNPGKIFAIAGMLFLSVGLISCWYLLPVFLSGSKFLCKATRFSAAATVILTGFLPGPWSHDLITNLASGAGLVALICTLIYLRNSHWRLLFWFGILNLLLVAINNYFYYSSDLNRYLPVLQKFTFLSFIVWMASVVSRMKTKAGHRAADGSNQRPKTGASN